MWKKAGDHNQQHATSNKINNTMLKVPQDSKILVTGGAGFIGSNLVEYFLGNGNQVVCLDNLATGHFRNIEPFLGDSLFQFIEGDIRDLDTCRRAVRGCEFVLHQAALGSVPRSINDPITTNAVNIDGFVNMLVAARDEKVKRFIYAASSSTYGDSDELPKVEERIGNPLSPYAITKLVNEHYARVFSQLYGIETIGLRYFNVFGKRQDPNGAYAAVIPLWVKMLIRHEQPVINGDGSYSRDFTYIDNVILANELAATAPTETILKQLKAYNGNREPATISEVFNVAYGTNTTLNQLFKALRSNLAKFDPAIANIEPVHGPVRTGDIPHSLASVEKARQILGYNPQYNAEQGFEMACQWYFENLR
jgi:UDP-N-acetylglucosamine/UDP-N-acetylgalactosamine 4-epimerase